LYNSVIFYLASGDEVLQIPYRAVPLDLTGDFDAPRLSDSAPLENSWFRPCGLDWKQRHIVHTHAHTCKLMKIESRGKHYIIIKQQKITHFVERHQVE